MKKKTTLTPPMFSAPILSKGKKAPEAQQPAEFSMPEEIELKNSNPDEEDAKVLRDQLKAIAEKIDSKKKERHRIAAKKSKEKRLALKALQAGDASNLVAAAVKHVDSKVAAKEPVASDLVSYSIAEASISLNSLLKVIKYGNSFYVVNEYTNVFGTMTDVIKEFNTKIGALKEFSQRIIQATQP